MRHKKIFIGLAFLCFIVMGVIFHFRRDIVVAPIRCDKTTCKQNTNTKWYDESMH